MQEGNRLSRVSAIVLDLDNTLFDANQWCVAALRHAGRVRGLSSSAVDRAIDNYLETHQDFGHDIYNAILLGCMQSDSGSNIKALHDAAGHYLGQGLEWELYPGVQETLLDLSRRYRLALIADGPVEAQKAKVQALGLHKYIRSIVYSDSIDGVRSRRPDPRPFREMRDLLELPSNQILFVADQPSKDFRTPRFLGFLTCRVFTGPYRGQPYPDSDSEAEYETTSVARLGDLLAAPTLDLSSYAHLSFLKQPEDAAPADLQVNPLTHDASVAARPVDSPVLPQRPLEDIPAARRESPVLLPVSATPPPVQPAVKNPAGNTLANLN